MHTLARLLMTVVIFSCCGSASANVPCPPAEPLGGVADATATRLVVVVPSIDSTAQDWQSIREQLRQDPTAKGIAWLVLELNASALTRVNVRDLGNEVGSCIGEKVAQNHFKTVTLIGHSVGAMILRYAYLRDAGTSPAMTSNAAPTWSDKVDRILLFASINGGISTKRILPWWPFHRVNDKVMRSLGFLGSQLVRDSDFLADVRIAWMRHFALPAGERPNPLPHVAQFWGARDTTITQEDNADVDAFEGQALISIAEGDHLNLFRLEPQFASDPAGRWNLIRTQLLEPVSGRATPKHPPRRVLLIVRGIRDSSFSDWMTDMRARAESQYGKGNVEILEYGYFPALRFARKAERESLIPMLRNVYVAKLTQNPLTQFDFIGHSNGTYALAHTLRTTPAMQFRNIVLAAPVLPTDFDWGLLFDRRQILGKVRYDLANDDIPVGILCQALSAVWQSDVGPGGVFGFGEGGHPTDSRLVQVGWHHGGHGAALVVDEASGIDNRKHLLNFALNGEDKGSGSKLQGPPGWFGKAARFTPWAMWFTFLAIALFFGWLSRTRPGTAIWLGIGAFAFGVVAYIALDVW
jgi:pimeloyl-ACP methyl ester carboxylesterase